MKWTRHILLVLSILFLCSCNNKENTSSKIDTNTAEVTGQITSDTTSIITTVTTTLTTKITTETPVVNESIEESEQIFNDIECVCNQVFNGYINEPYDIFNGTEHITYDNEIEFFRAEVSKVKNSTLGEITDEQDLISKSREIFIEVLGQNFIASIEADYTIKNGVKLAIAERTTPLYYVEYCDEEDVWYIYPCMPSGKLEDGTGFITPYENGTFLMVRGSDGKIIGCQF